MSWKLELKKPGSRSHSFPSFLTLHSFSLITLPACPLLCSLFCLKFPVAAQDLWPASTPHFPGTWGSWFAAAAPASILNRLHTPVPTCGQSPMCFSAFAHTVLSACVETEASQGLCPLEPGCITEIQQPCSGLSSQLVGERLKLLTPLHNIPGVCPLCAPPLGSASISHMPIFIHLSLSSG